MVKTPVKPGRNVIVVRVWGHFGGGGVKARPEDMILELPIQKLSFYRSDFVLGDDPYRYKCR